MLVFGHAGITLGSAIVLNAVINRESLQKESLTSIAQINRYLTDRLKSLAQQIDLRVLLIGSILPDIIDKPLGRIIFRNSISNGRIYCHTTLFLLLISIIGIYLYVKFRNNHFLILSFGTFTHLIFDQMWLASHTLFWPLYGWNFPQGESNITIFIKDILIGLITSPGTYIPEIIGAIVMLVFTCKLIKLKTFNNFIKKGYIYNP